MAERLINIKSISFDFKDAFLDIIHYSPSTLEIILGNDNDNYKLRLLFEWFYSFRVTNESDLLKMQDDLMGDMISGMYKVEGSSYLKWFNEQSYNAVHVDDDIIHYLVVTDDIIEILSSTEPVISVINTC